MSKQSTGQHLKELRMRFFIVAIFFIFGACLAYAFQEQVIHAVLAPLHGQKLVYLNPAGGFNFIFLISIYAGLAMAIPVLIHQLYAFVRPALPTSAQKKSYTLIIGSFLLLVAGILFGYLVAVPSALTFLYGFADAYIDASLTAESYLNFIIAYTIGIGLVFQIPLILLLINSIKPLTPGGLMKSERWIILGSVIVAAVITPTPDPINQLIVAGPVIIVYQIGVIIILTSIHKKYRASKKLARKAIKAQRQKAAPRHAPVPAPIPQHTAPQLNSAMQTAIKQPAVAQQRKETKPAHTHSVDGFIRTPRPAVQRVTIPVRQKPQAKPVDRVIPRVPSPTQRNFTIDGMYRPVYPTN